MSLVATMYYITYAGQQVKAKRRERGCPARKPPVPPGADLRKVIYRLHNFSTKE
jgi:hypothetical protein